MTQATYKISGMTCGGCAGSVTKALEEALGTVKVEAKVDGGLILIDGEHDAKTVEDTIEAAGFTFEGKH